MDNAGYLTSKIKGKTVSLHDYIMKPPDDKGVDHRDRNPRNNCRSNLRYCTKTENQQNRSPYSTYSNKPPSSKYKGVHFVKPKKKWRVQIMVDGQNIELGLFIDEIAAAQCYNFYADMYFKEFAFLNDVPTVREEVWRNQIFQRKKSSKYLGISFIENRWVAQIHRNGVNERVGSSLVEEEAAKMYDKRSREIRGINTKKVNFKLEIGGEILCNSTL